MLGVKAWAHLERRRKYCLLKYPDPSLASSSFTRTSINCKNVAASCRRATVSHQHTRRDTEVFGRFISMHLKYVAPSVLVAYSS